MAAASEVSRRVGRLAYPLSTRHAERLRARLLAGMGDQSADLAQHAATLEALRGSPCDELADRNRAMAALAMFVAYEAVEEIADAIARFDDGNYGLCQACQRQIPLERLETSPAARFCADCPGTAPWSVAPREASDAPGARRNHLGSHA
jgi:RNA polymerase-binding transcription factor DksA